MSSKRKLIYKDIDTLRFIAIVPIILYCLFYLLNSYKDNFLFVATAGSDYLKMASIEFFFFLSSFLMVAHALREYKYQSKFSLRFFFVRKLFKIVPIYLVLLLFSLLILPWIYDILQLADDKNERFYSNLIYFTSRPELFSTEQILLLSSTVLVGAYLVFYAILGVVMKFFRLNLKLISYVFIGLGILARAYHVLIESDFELDILAYFVPIGLGIFFADFVRNEKRKVDLFKEIPKATIALVYLIGITFMITGYYFLKGSYISLVVPVILCLFYGFVILEQTFGKHSILKFRRFSRLAKIGRMSFGLFVYTLIISVIIFISLESLEFDSKSAVTQMVFLFLSITLGLVTALFSYNRFEKPISRIKSEFKKS